MKKSFLSSRVAYYVGFSLFYCLMYLMASFELACMCALGTIVGEQAYLQKTKSEE